VVIAVEDHVEVPEKGVFPVEFVEPERLVAQNGGADPGGPQTVGAGQHEGPDHDPPENLVAHFPGRQG
jgi:hypothetical protein